MTEHEPISQSDASQHIEALMQSKKARLIPYRLVGKPIDWEFYVNTNEMLGYQVYVSESNKILLVNLDGKQQSTRGRYVITEIGPAKDIIFKGQIGEAPNIQFLAIRKLDGVTTIAFIKK